MFTTLGQINFVATMLLLLMSSAWAGGHANDMVGQDSAEGGFELTVYKTPTCGCCGKWVSYMEDSGFNVSVRELRDVSPVKQEAGIPVTHRSCHTAIAEKGGYIFEGHIPAKFVKAFLADPPADARGLMVPAMPVGSPGMEYGDQFAAYDVFTLNVDGTIEVYASVNSAADASD